MDTSDFDKRWLRRITMAGNLLVLVYYWLFPALGLLFPRREVLTGTVWETPLIVTLTIWFVLAVSTVFAMSLVGVYSGRRLLPRGMTVLCLSILAVLEIYETIMVHQVYGPISPQLSAYVGRGPLLVFWAIVNWYAIVRGEPRNPVTAATPPTVS